MRRLDSIAATFVALLFAPIALAAQAGDSGTAASLAVENYRQWVPARVSQAVPLHRQIKLELAGVPLKDALQQIARQGGLRLGYSGAVPRSPVRVSLHSDSLTVLGALTAALDGTGFQAFVSLRGDAVLVSAVPPAPPPPTGTIVGRVTDAKEGTAIVGAIVEVQGTARSATTNTDGRFRIMDVAPGTYTVRARYIGYTPSTASATIIADQEATADFALERSTQELNEIVTTGTVVPTEVKAIPTPISVVTAADIQRLNLQRVDQIFRGAVPGVIAWDMGAYDYASNIAVRGASSLGARGIKTYIDGVEVANKNFIATIDPNSIERIEITRGPQASTLYGSEALDGVMQIFTKKGEAGLGRPRMAGKVSAGGIGGVFGAGTAFQTDNSLSVFGGTERASYNLGGSYRHRSAWTPSYGATDYDVAAGGRFSQGALSLSASARYSAHDGDSPWLAQFRDYTAFSKPPNETQPIRQQTYGVTATYMVTRSWRHTAILGYDGTQISLFNTRPILTTPADTFLSVSLINYPKTSLLYYSDYTFHVGSGVSGTATAGINYFTENATVAIAPQATRNTGTLNGPTLIVRTPSQGIGYLGQVQVGLADRLFLTAGLRADRNDDFGEAYGTAWSPRAGASYVLAGRGVQLKLRGSYGEAIRAPGFGLRDPAISSRAARLANPNLRPERQRGVDAGFDLFAGSGVSLGVTYYHQRAVDLIQAVNLPVPSGSIPTSQYQNVGEVKNEGLEIEGRLAMGRVDLAGTYTLTRSTIQALPASYTGDYRIGDDVRGVPRDVVGASVTYTPFGGTALTAAMTHIGHWTDTDYIAYYGSIYGGQPYRGSDRAYWMVYPAVTKLALGVSQQVTPEIGAFVRAENVGNTLRYERLNYQPPLPRSITVGATFRY